MLILVGSYGGGTYDFPNESVFVSKQGNDMFSKMS